MFCVFQPLKQKCPMSLIQCPDCSEAVSEEATSCPKCGRVIKKEQSATGILAAIIIGLIGAYFVIKLFTQ